MKFLYHMPSSHIQLTILPTHYIYQNILKSLRKPGGFVPAILARLAFVARSAPFPSVFLAKGFLFWTLVRVRVGEGRSLGGSF